MNVPSHRYAATLRWRRGFDSPSALLRNSGANTESAIDSGITSSVRLAGIPHSGIGAESSSGEYFFSAIVGVPEHARVGRRWAMIAIAANVFSSALACHAPNAATASSDQRVRKGAMPVNPPGFALLAPRGPRTTLPEN